MLDLFYIILNVHSLIAYENSHHIQILICQTFLYIARNSLNGKTGDYIAARCARSDYSKTQLRLSLHPPLILLALVNRVQELRKRRGRPRPPYLLLTSISLTAQDIYFEDITVTLPAIEAAEFARKSTMQNYCPLTSLPILECVDEESFLPH